MRVQILIAAFIFAASSYGISAAATDRSQKGAKAVTSEAKAPLEFKGLTMGAKSADLDLAFYRCSIEPSVFNDSVCFRKWVDGFTIAEQPVKDAHLSFIDDRLVVIYLSIDESNFQAVVGALTEKYGKGKRSLETLSNRLGAQFESATVVWALPSGRITIQQRAGNPDVSAVQFYTPDYLDVVGKRIAESKKSGAKDL